MSKNHEFHEFLELTTGEHVISSGKILDVRMEVGGCAVKKGKEEAAKRWLRKQGFSDDLSGKNLCRVFKSFAWSEWPPDEFFRFKPRWKMFLRTPSGSMV